MNAATCTDSPPRKGPRMKNNDYLQKSKNDFLAYVAKHSVRVPFSGCTIWLGAVTEGGYGRSIVAQKTYGTSVVHRALFQALHGDVLRGLYVCHACDTPACVNPEHLFLGTPSDNAQDRTTKRRSAPTQGDTNGRSVLKHDQVKEIKRQLNEGLRIADLARTYGVNHSTVSHIKHRRTWRQA